MFDWNKNGEYDTQDAFIDYQIFNAVSQKELYEAGSGDGMGMLSLVGIGLLIFGIIIIFA